MKILALKSYIHTGTFPLKCFCWISWTKWCIGGQLTALSVTHQIIDAIYDRNETGDWETNSDKSSLEIALLLSLAEGREPVTQFGKTQTWSESNARAWVRAQDPASRCNIETHFTTSSSWQSEALEGEDNGQVGTGEKAERLNMVWIWSTPFQASPGIMPIWRKLQNASRLLKNGLWTWNFLWQCNADQTR